MGKMSQADFYFGAALSVLFNNNMKPALVENGIDRRIYDLSTNNGDYKIYIKYRTKPVTENDNVTSWQFHFNNAEIEELNNHLNDSLLLIFICGNVDLKKSELAILNHHEIKKAICDRGRDNITIGRKKHAHSFYISMGGGRINDLHIRANKLNLSVHSTV